MTKKPEKIYYYQEENRFDLFDGFTLQKITEEFEKFAKLYNFDIEDVQADCVSADSWDSGKIRLRGARVETDEEYEARLLLLEQQKKEARRINRLKAKENKEKRQKEEYELFIKLKEKYEGK